MASKENGDTKILLKKEKIEERQSFQENKKQNVRNKRSKRETWLGK